MLEKTMVTLSDDTLLWLDQQILETRHKHKTVIDRGMILRGVLKWAMLNGIWFVGATTEDDMGLMIEKALNEPQ